MLNITHRTIWTADQDNFSGFHPRCCLIPQANTSPKLLMTVQEISGSDYFHAVQYCTSSDLGKTWSPRQTIDAFIWKDYRDNIIRGVCDTVPHYHPQTNTVLAVAHDVYYLDGKLLDTVGHWNKDNIGYQSRITRRAVYVTSPADRINFSPMQLIEMPNLDDCSICTSGTSDKVITPQGTVLIPFHYSTWGRHDHMVFTAEFNFDGQNLTFIRRGNDLELPVNRGLLEPQLTCFNDTFYLSLRAEDSRAYLSTSTDGITWSPIKPWTFDNDQPVTTDTTQQHWLTLADRLYLIYTRLEPGLNDNVTRWRSPLWIAQVDTHKNCLIKKTEQIVLPSQGNSKSTPIMGNFQPTAIAPDKAILTVGAVNTQDFKADTLIAQIEPS